MTTIYHNPRCSKSREALGLLEEKGETIKVLLYLKEIPTPGHLKQLVTLLNCAPLDLVRTNEPIWKEKYQGLSLTDDEIISAMAQHPILIERPIVVKGNKAIIARPPTKILELL